MALRRWHQLRIRAALAVFRRVASKDQYDQTMDILQEHHEKAAAALEGEKEFTAEPGFAHGLEATNALQSHHRPLPSRPDELGSTVNDDGQLLGVGRWELLDPRWIGSLEAWLLHLLHKAKFNSNPATIDIPDQASLALVGDWGTGRWRLKNCPSKLVGDQVRKLKPDYTIHLGDVYYAGTRRQERMNLSWIWPEGTRGSFTLNSNHEMYSGALNYYKGALKSRRFKLQNHCSYFALQNSNWLIIGLDTAYWSDHWGLYMKGKLDDGQINWLKSLPKDKRVIVMSHHQGYDITGKQTTSCYDQVVEGLGRAPDYWYWGHLHNAIAYEPIGDFHGRCIGHGAIPYGDASMLAGVEQVAWYEQEIVGDRKRPMRVQNGFAHVVLDGPDLKERMIGEDGSTRWEPKNQQ